jgi:4a-hydroxytetrahydrobiopterin dehydratase
MTDRAKPERLSGAQVAERAALVPDWMLGEDVISCELEFEDFRESMAFVESVAKLAEEHDHHPDIFISYNHVRLDLSTHTAGGLTEKDFALAQDIDRLL